MPYVRKALIHSLCQSETQASHPHLYTAQRGEEREEKALPPQHSDYREQEGGARDVVTHRKERERF